MGISINCFPGGIVLHLKQIKRQFYNCGVSPAKNKDTRHAASKEVPCPPDFSAAFPGFLLAEAFHRRVLCVEKEKFIRRPRIPTAGL